MITATPHDVNGIEIRPGDRVRIEDPRGRRFGTAAVLESMNAVLVDLDGAPARRSFAADRLTILDPEVKR